MRIFKNRGDIYFSKVNKKKSAEQRILITALIVILVFTMFFVTALAVKYNFSAKKFFAPDDLILTQITDEQEEPLPQVSGKSNYILLVNSDDNLLFVTLIQVDMDNISYKISNLKASTICDGTSLSEVFKQSGAQNVQKAVESLLGTEFDYYISMDHKKFADFFDELGDFYYPILSEIKYKSSGEEVNYSVKLKSGEQKLNGSQVVNLIRYYLDEQNNSSAANDLILNSLLQQSSSKNFAKSETLFRHFVTSADTNITVRDFSLAGDKILVLTDERTGINTYSAIAEYDSNSISNDSLQKIKGYFIK